jgi:MoaA/NifB/PqqE/SkfB family radical SAM enzyme
VAAIDLALARRIPVYVNQVVTQENLDEVEPMLEFCESRGIKLNAQPVMRGVEFYDNDAIATRLMLSHESTTILFGRLAAWRRAGRSVLFSAETYQQSGEWNDYSKMTEASEGESTCMAGRYYVHIGANGDIRPCIQHGQPFTPMNLLRDGLEAALEHAQHHSCGNCYTVYLNERKSLFSLRPAALLGTLRRE